MARGWDTFDTPYASHEAASTPARQQYGTRHDLPQSPQSSLDKQFASVHSIQVGDGDIDKNFSSHPPPYTYDIQPRPRRRQWLVLGIFITIIIIVIAVGIALGVVISADSRDDKHDDVVKHTHTSSYSSSAARTTASVQVEAVAVAGGNRPSGTTVQTGQTGTNPASDAWTTPVALASGSVGNGGGSVPTTAGE